jgi:uncharacterized protein YjbI with pentapeptide repeats
MADEQDITSDENAITELEIEAIEGPAEKTVKEPNANAATEGNRGETGCPIWMDDFYGVRCGRTLHVAPDGVDVKPVCLMHSQDPNKQSGPLFDAFWQEFERILKDAGEGEAYFVRFVFPRINFNFRLGTFQAICWFDYAIFTEYTNFLNVTFSKYVSFLCATFTQDAIFSEATFAQNADFWNTTFAQNAVFYKATFSQDANFNGATFEKDAAFGEATFTQAVHFVNTVFHRTAIWDGSRFLDRAEFRRTKFLLKNAIQPNAVFTLAIFSKPGEIVFDDVNLSHALFYDCDVSQLWFTSSAHWDTRKNKRGFAVFEETIPLEQWFAFGLKRNGQRDYRAVAQIYQQLKKNYDSRLDYWTANEFHFGEMEMKRLAGPAGGPLLQLRQWWHPRLSFVALYRYASDYGNSYGKPMLWLLGTLVLFAALLPLPGVGLKRQGVRQAETYASVWRTGDGWSPNLRAEVRLAGKGAITSVDAATFQRSAEYAPAYPWGRVLAIFETLLTSSLFALFLLAIRRQFRR